MRDWPFVEDHADALLHILSHGKIGRSYNVGGENECSNIDLVQRICSILDRVHPKTDASYADLITFVTDPETCAKQILNRRPIAVINAAAYTAVDNAETE